MNITSRKFIYRAVYTTTLLIGTGRYPFLLGGAFLLALGELDLWHRQHLAAVKSSQNQRILDHCLNNKLTKLIKNPEPLKKKILDAYDPQNPHESLLPYGYALDLISGEEWMEKIPQFSPSALKFCKRHGATFLKRLERQDRLICAVIKELIGMDTAYKFAMKRYGNYLTALKCVKKYQQELTTSVNKRVAGLKIKREAGRKRLAGIEQT